MATYEGPATVTADGAEYDVQASLELTTDSVPVPGRAPMQGLPSWHGTLHVTDDEAEWNIFQADEKSIQIDGRVGQFITTNSQVGTGEIVIKGSGTAPFGR
ncbi:hypothetical protein AB0D99_10600 [Streptomyces sp. NPDC047971]|uniref:hypothetical protein n=1 Tax=Streptomyces sp. NPDC047971 TaxID=3154499 RepID=UPI0033C6E81A